MIDDSWDHKDGQATAHVGRQWLSRYGKTGNGIVTVTTVWTDGNVCQATAEQANLRPRQPR